MHNSLFPEEESFVAKIKAGDDSILAYVYRKYYPMISHLINTNHGNENDAEDIYQEAFIIIYQKIKNGELDTITCTLKTYIYSVCRLKWLDRLRYKGKYGEKFIDTYDHIAINAMPEKEEEPMPYQQAMHTALDLIGETCKQLLLAFYFEKLPMNEIAVRFGYNRANTAKAKKNKCMDKLREEAKKIMKTLEKK